MSSSATPISPARFAAALPSLPLSNLHLKAAELRNSIAHLEYSNLQLQPLAEEGDRDCEEAVKENRETIARMEEVGSSRALLPFGMFVELALLPETCLVR